MSVNTILLDFSIEPQLLLNEGPDKFQTEVVNLLESKFGGSGTMICILNQTEIPSTTNPGLVSMYTGPKGSTIAVRLFTRNGLVTINLDYYKEDNEAPLLNLQDCAELEGRLSIIGRTSKQVKTLPAIRRGIPFDRYFWSTDERLLEYDTDALLYDEHSEFQHIQIVHSAGFGNMLVLDDDLNMSVSDLIYTESIMRRGVECYRDKDILILGGGDGGLLKELTKENPRMVIMVEIDEMVIQGCKKYLRGTCGDVLDNYRGDNYEIIIGDCVNFLAMCISENRTFDYVFGDLTQIPISATEEEMETWTFIKKILTLSFRVLRSNGKYMTHGHSTPCQKAKEMYAQVLKQLDDPVKVDKIDAFVPSFMEGWTFYRIQRI